MTIAVDLGRKATKQTNKSSIVVFQLCQEYKWITCHKMQWLRKNVCKMLNLCINSQSVALLIHGFKPVKTIVFFLLVVPYHNGLLSGKPVLGVSDDVRNKPACLATNTS